MLKSVSLDEKEHSHLIDFINSYRDDNGNNNISSAIRFLMEKGYEFLYGKVPVQIPYKKQKLNKDELKREVMNEILSELNLKLLDKLTSALAPNQVQPILINPMNIPVQYTPQNNQQVTSQINSQINSQYMPSNNDVKQAENSNSTDISKYNDISVEKTNEAVQKTKISGNTLLSNLLSNASR